MPDWIFYAVGVAEAALIVTMLWVLGRYDQDHPAAS